MVEPTGVDALTWQIHCLCGSLMPGPPPLPSPLLLLAWRSVHRAVTGANGAPFLAYLRRVSHVMGRVEV